MKFTTEGAVKALYLAAKAFVTSFEMDSQVRGNQPTGNAAPVQSVATGQIPECPRHHKPMREGQYGWYCATKETDPNYANKNGYCGQKM